MKSMSNSKSERKLSEKSEKRKGKSRVLSAWMDQSLPLPNSYHKLNQRAYRLHEHEDFSRILGDESNPTAPVGKKRMEYCVL